MQKPTRLFDCIAAQMLKDPDGAMLSGKENKIWCEYKTKEVAETVNQLSSGL